MRRPDISRETGPRLAGLFLALLAALPVAAAEIAPEEAGRLAGADVLVLGEVHDNPAHHLNQAAIVAALSPRALVFEMFGPEEALAITPEVLASPEALGRLLRWDERGWPDFAMYYPVFLAAGEAPLFGGAVPRAEVRRAVREGAAAVLGGAAPAFGLDRALDPEEQALREEMQMEAHCDALPEEILPGMVEAQRLRDAGLANAVMAAMAETGGPVAVITGNGHARTDWGLPRLLARTLPDARVVALGQFEVPPAGSVPYDYWIVTEPAEREDPCLAFRQPD